MNPAGIVNIKIIRNTDDKIAGVAYMTDAEVTSLLSDIDDDDWPDDADENDDWQKDFGGRVWHPQVFPVDQESIADGETVWLGEYTLSEGDRILLNIHYPA